jgi:hypothetical protein
MLLPIGLIPLIAGFGLNYIITDLNIYGFGFTVICIAFLLAWFFIGFSVAKIKLDFFSVIVYSLAVGIVNYIFIVYQLLIMDKWADGLLGLVSQFYILPTIRFLNYINWFNIFSSPFAYATASMFILFIVFFFGAYISRKNVENRARWEMQ